MEKLTIKPWQVMQAFENGAKIEMSLIGSSKWTTVIDVLWNWCMRNYRIANLTADGMRLDDLVEKFPDRVLLEELELFACEDSVDTKSLIDLLLKKPNLICKVKVKQEKKLRPWTMEEFEKHRDEWFITDGTKERIKAGAYDEIGVVFGRNIVLKYREILEHLNFEDGSPCGVLE